jgi:hypothetical protein
MSEQSTEQLVKSIERKMRLREALAMLLCDLAISAIISDPHVAREAFKKVHAPDTLPHD